MTEANTTPSTMTIGIDLGDRKSHVCVLDAAGEVVEESRIARARFEGLAPTRIAALVRESRPGASSRAWQGRS